MMWERVTSEVADMGIFDWKHWVVIGAVAVLLFGGKRIRTLGSDIGQTIKGFKTAVAEESTENRPGEVAARSVILVDKESISS